MFTSNELMLSHGLPVMCEPSFLQQIEGETLPWLDFYAGLTRTQRLVLLGNGVHADSMGAFVLYVISSLVHISQLSQMAQGDLMAQVRLCDTVLEISDYSDDEDHRSPAAVTPPVANVLVAEAVAAEVFAVADDVIVITIPD